MLNDKLVDDIKELCLNEDNTLWQMGDLLVTAALSDEEMAKLAVAVSRKIGTLKDRERNAREFPTEKRDKRYAWGVYKALWPIPNAEDRQQLLDSRTAWTIDSIQMQVRLWVEKEAEGKGLRGPSQKLSSNMRLGNYRVSGELINGVIKLSIPTGAAEVKTFELNDETILQVVLSD